MTPTAYFNDPRFIALATLPQGNGDAHTSALNLGPLLRFLALPDGLGALVTIPPLTSAQMPDGAALTVSLVAGPEATTTEILATAETLTAADGDGTPQKELAFRIPNDAGRFVRAKITVAGGATSVGMIAARLTVTH